MKTYEELLAENEQLKSENIELHSRINYGLNLEPYQYDLPIINAIEGIPYLSKNDELSYGTTGIKNRIVQSDNFELLYLLNNITEPFVNIIYIDPPYNFVQNYGYRNYVRNHENQFDHSEWLNIMKLRLSLARNLLTDDGIIYISIDDTEYAYLKVLMDQIFGEKNYIGTIIRDKMQPHPNAANIETLHEYILVYAKVNKPKLLQTSVRRKVEILSDENGEFFYKKALEVGAFGLNERPNMGYRIWYNPETKDIVSDNEYNREKARISNDESEIYSDNHDELISAGYIRIMPNKYAGRLGCRACSYEKFLEMKNELVLLKNSADRYEIYRKEYISENSAMRMASIKSIVKFPSQEGTRSCLKIFNNENRFKYPKNIELLKFLIRSYYRNDAVVLDFFAGSGSTGQAVLELNSEDSGTRRFILNSNNENDICSNVCQPRIKTVLSGTRFDGTKYSDGLSGNFDYLTIKYDDEINVEHIKQTKQLFNNLMENKNEY